MIITDPKETEKLFNAITANEISPDYLRANGWGEAGAEQTAAYFAGIQKHFEATRKVIQFISGSLILIQCQEKVRHEIFHPLKLAKELLDETQQEVQSMTVHKALQQHHSLLKHALSCLATIFEKIKIEQNMIYLNKQQIDNVLSCVQQAFRSLQLASAFEMGLNMVSLDASCAGHSH